MMSWVAIVVLSLFLLFSLYKNYRFGVIILRMEDSIEECLDVIDQKYESVSMILKRPLFFDSPEVRKVLSDIESVKRSLHAVALSLAENIDENIDEKQDGE